MPKIYIKNQNREIEYSIGKSLLDILIENNIFVDNPCNGKGLCGKCKVKIISGNFEEIHETESNLLSEKEIKEGIRLSCIVIPREDITIEVLQKERKHNILTEGFIPSFKYNPSIIKRVVNINKPSLQNQISYEDLLIKTFNIDNVDWNVLKEELIYDEVTGIFNGDNLIGIEKGDTKNLLYGIAVDIGTTTVITSLINMNTGEEISTESMINSQKKFGLDVLTRITYKLENPKTAQKELQSSIVESINNMIEKVCNVSKVNKENIYEMSIAGNSTMMHFLLGVDTDSIGKSPYAPVFIKSKNILARDIGFKINKSARLYCLPSVSSYIGADIVAGAYVCNLSKESKNVLFIDIGTNGEIVLSNKGKLLSCSCAAGPALEGMNISSGMRAAEGAIEDIKISENGIELKVIGNKSPIGICGSGILAVLKELLKVKLVRKQGAFIKKDTLKENDYRFNMLQENGKKREFIINKDPLILVTQSDIRQVQLAKGAILSGFYALLKKANLSMDDLDKVIIAGQFGAHLSIDSLIGTGILPKGINNLEYVGNSSKTGAYMCLMSKEVKREIEELSGKIDYMELGASENYEKLFAECLMFPSI